MGQIFVKHCPLCDSQRFESAQEVSGYALTVCLDCGHIFLNAISTETQGLYEVYAPDPGNIAKEVEAQKARVANVMRFRQPPGKLVDVGCGPGFFLKAARDAGFAVQGCELSTGCVQFAQSTWGIEILQGDFCECPLEPGIQAITMYHTLEHIESPADTSLGHGTSWPAVGSWSSRFPTYFLLIRSTTRSNGRAFVCRRICSFSPVTRWTGSCVIAAFGF